jgi:hypothetical protein
MVAAISVVTMFSGAVTLYMFALPGFSSARPQEGEVGFGLPPPVQRVLPSLVTFWRRSCCGPQFVLDYALTSFLCCRSSLCDQVDQGPCARCSARLPTAIAPANRMEPVLRTCHP